MSLQEIVRCAKEHGCKARIYNGAVDVVDANGATGRFGNMGALLRWLGY
jgi:hypothetical protein